MIETITPRINTLEQSDIFGKFIVEPLEKGYGTTMGNALRRVMLSSIAGAAITAIKIDGVLHEFSTIPGVKEDATELILNLKEVAIKVHPDGGTLWEPKTLRIDVKGAGDVTGADIQTPEDVEIANPEVYIASLSNESSHLSMEMTVEVGKGYVLPEKHEKKHTIGIIPVGSAFTPVRKVNYVVEPTRVGHKTDYERLILEVTTNGTILPSDAISEAAKILDRQLHLFFDFASGGSAISFLEALPGAGAEVKAPDARIEELDFSVRTYNCLKKANILTIRDLVQTTEAELMGIRNFGKKSLTEVKDKLAQFGLQLRKPAAGEAVYTAEADEDEEAEEEYEEAGE